MPLSSATEVVTLAQAKARLRVTSTAFDDEITGIIGAGVEYVANAVKCSILERQREDVVRPAGRGPVMLRHRGLLLLPAIAEDTTAMPPIAARAARSVTFSYSAPADDIQSPRTQTLELEAANTRVDYSESPVGPADESEPLRFGRAVVYPPTDGWPRYKGNAVVRYFTGAPSADVIPQAWKEAVLEFCRDVFDRQDEEHKFVRQLVYPWARFT